jgi:hypothetical protein
VPRTIFGLDGWTIHRGSRFGYGFLRPETTIPEIGDGEVFCGSVQLRLEPLRHGDRISFDLKKAGDDRWEACNIALLDMAAA